MLVISLQTGIESKSKNNLFFAEGVGGGGVAEGGGSEHNK